MLQEWLRAQLCREKTAEGRGEARGQALPAGICSCLPLSALADSFLIQAEEKPFLSILVPLLWTRCALEELKWSPFLVNFS